MVKSLIHASIGRVLYDPRSEKTAFKPWWVILQCDKEIVRYYQHIFYKLYWKKLQTPVWQSHLSIVRGEEPQLKNNWGKWHGKYIEYEYIYDGHFENNGIYFWLKARSLQLNTIREELGIDPKPTMDFHISIGSLNA
jgi:hypothetical protein